MIILLLVLSYKRKIKARLEGKGIPRIRSEVWQACRDSETTLHYLDDLMDTAEKTILFPKSASPLYFENRFTGYYRVPYKAYLIFYRLDGARVLIERILHSGTDYLKLLKW